MVSLKDEAIQRQVEQAIGFDPRVNGFDVKVRVHQGVVQLEGITRNLEAKRAAGEAAARIAGVQRVENTLTVEDPKGLPELEIARAVDEELNADPEVDPRAVGVFTVDGAAFLVGHVDSVGDEELAVEAASRADGVKEVISQLDISPGRDVDWADLKNAVADALDAAGAFSPYAIDVAVETGGRVVLSGYVNDDESRRRAAEIAGQVDGVQAVVNRLRLQ